MGEVQPLYSDWVETAIPLLGVVASDPLLPTITSILRESLSLPNAEDEGSGSVPSAKINFFVLDAESVTSAPSLSLSDSVKSSSENEDFSSSQWQEKTASSATKRLLQSPAAMLSAGSPMKKSPFRSGLVKLGWMRKVLKRRPFGYFACLDWRNHPETLAASQADRRAKFNELSIRFEAPSMALIEKLKELARRRKTPCKLVVVVILPHLSEPSKTGSGCLKRLRATGINAMLVAAGPEDLTTNFNRVTRTLLDFAADYYYHEAKRYRRDLGQFKLDRAQPELFRALQCRKLFKAAYMLEMCRSFDDAIETYNQVWAILSKQDSSTALIDRLTLLNELNTRLAFLHFSNHEFGKVFDNVRLFKVKLFQEKVVDSELNCMRARWLADVHLYVGATLENFTHTTSKIVDIQYLRRNSSYYSYVGAFYLNSYSRLIRELMAMKSMPHTLAHSSNTQSAMSLSDSQDSNEKSPEWEVSSQKCVEQSIDFYREALRAYQAKSWMRSCVLVERRIADSLFEDDKYDEAIEVYQRLIDCLEISEPFRGSVGSFSRRSSPTKHSHTVKEREKQRKIGWQGLQCYLITRFIVCKLILMGFSLFQITCYELLYKFARLRGLASFQRDSEELLCAEEASHTEAANLEESGVLRVLIYIFKVLDMVCVANEEEWYRISTPGADSGDFFSNFLLFSLSSEKESKKVSVDSTPLEGDASHAHQLYRLAVMLASTLQGSEKLSSTPSLLCDSQEVSMCVQSEPVGEVLGRPLRMHSLLCALSLGKKRVNHTGIDSSESLNRLSLHTSKKKKPPQKTSGLIGPHTSSSSSGGLREKPELNAMGASAKSEHASMPLMAASNSCLSSFSGAEDVHQSMGYGGGMNLSPSLVEANGSRSSSTYSSAFATNTTSFPSSTFSTMISFPSSYPSTTTIPFHTPLNRDNPPVVVGVHTLQGRTEAELNPTECETLGESSSKPALINGGNASVCADSRELPLQPPPEVNEKGTTYKVQLQLCLLGRGAFSVGIKECRVFTDCGVFVVPFAGFLRQSKIPVVFIPTRSMEDDALSTSCLNYGGKLASSTANQHPPTANLHPLTTKNHPPITVHPPEAQAINSSSSSELPAFEDSSSAADSHLQRLPLSQSLSTNPPSSPLQVPVIPVIASSSSSLPPSPHESLSPSSLPPAYVIEAFAELKLFSSVNNDIKNSCLGVETRTHQDRLKEKAFLPFNSSWEPAGSSLPSAKASSEFCLEICSENFALLRLEALVVGLREGLPSNTTLLNEQLHRVCAPSSQAEPEWLELCSSSNGGVEAISHTKAGDEQSRGWIGHMGSEFEAHTQSTGMLAQAAYSHTVELTVKSIHLTWDRCDNVVFELFPAEFFMESESFSESFGWAEGVSKQSNRELALAGNVCANELRLSRNLMLLSQRFQKSLGGIMNRRSIANPENNGPFSVASLGSPLTFIEEQKTYLLIKGKACEFTLKMLLNKAAICSSAASSALLNVSILLTNEDLQKRKKLAYVFQNIEEDGEEQNYEETDKTSYIYLKAAQVGLTNFPANLNFWEAEKMHKQPEKDIEEEEESDEEDETAQTVEFVEKTGKKSIFRREDGVSAKLYSCEQTSSQKRYSRMNYLLSAAPTTSLLREYIDVPSPLLEQARDKGTTTDGFTSSSNSKHLYSAENSVFMYTPNRKAAGSAYEKFLSPSAAEHLIFLPMLLLIDGPAKIVFTISFFDKEGQVLFDMIQRSNFDVSNPFEVNIQLAPNPDPLITHTYVYLNISITSNHLHVIKLKKICVFDLDGRIIAELSLTGTFSEGESYEDSPNSCGLYGMLGKQLPSEERLFLLTMPMTEKAKISSSSSFSFQSADAEVSLTLLSKLKIWYSLDFHSLEYPFDVLGIPQSDLTFQLQVPEMLNSTILDVSNQPLTVDMFHEALLFLGKASTFSATIRNSTDLPLEIIIQLKTCADVGPKQKKLSEVEGLRSSVTASAMNPNDEGGDDADSAHTVGRSFSYFTGGPKVTSTVLLPYGVEVYTWTIVPLKCGAMRMPCVQVALATSVDPEGPVGEPSVFGALSSASNPYSVYAKGSSKVYQDSIVYFSVESYCHVLPQ